jgi:release factor glutamine methyltransferase
VTRADLVDCVSRALGSRTEARGLVDEVLGPGGPTVSVPEAAQVRADDLVARRRSGEPLQYVLGRWAFRHLELAVDSRVLIPRPETEQVTEVALALLAGLPRGPTGPVVVDLGTGSGAIALSLALEGVVTHPGLAVWATDVDPDALAVAEANRLAMARRFQAIDRRVHLARGSWWGALPDELAGGVDLVVTNPPYVGGAEWADLDPEVRAEPRRALVAGPGRDGTPGLADVEAVLADAGHWLARPGAAVLEIAPHQALAARSAARRAGAADVFVEPDLAGRDRTLVARWS